MEAVVEFVAAHPLFLVPAALVLTVVGYAILKRLLKLAVLLLIFFAIYAGLTTLIS